MSVNLPGDNPDSTKQQVQKEQKALFDKLTGEGMDKKQAALFAGYSPETRPEERPSKRIAKALQVKGVNDDKLAETIRNGLDAKTRFDTPDHNAITKYLALAGKWLGYEKDNLSVQVGLNVSGQVIDPNKLNESMRIIEAEIVQREHEGTKEAS